MTRDQYDALWRKIRHYQHQRELAARDGDWVLLAELEEVLDYLHEQFYGEYSPV